ncbi:MAG: twin-arginine translocation signal domain-containing protein, partial [Gemmatimonadetes bacterium]|nr:twin-arginine translocation signal domain-containing protein [Gemmatimonadota bacterium]
MLIRKNRAGEGDIPSSEITPYETYVNRRRFMQAAGLAAAAAAIPGGLAACSADDAQGRGMAEASDEELDVSQSDEPNSYEDITTYNNFYEFGTDKRDPARNSGDFKPRPWTVEVAGLVENPGTFGLEDFLRPHEVVEPTYRLRCVEAWSMVI